MKNGHKRIVRLTLKIDTIRKWMGAPFDVINIAGATLYETFKGPSFPKNMDTTGCTQIVDKNGSKKIYSKLY